MLAHTLTLDRLAREGVNTPLSTTTVENIGWEDFLEAHTRVHETVSDILGGLFCPSMESFEQDYIPNLTPYPHETDYQYDLRLSLYVEKRFFPAKRGNSLANSESVWICYNPFIEELDGVSEKLVLAPMSVIDAVMRGGRDSQKALVPWNEKETMDQWVTRLLTAAHHLGANDVEITSFTSSMKVRIHHLGKWSDWLGSLPLTQRGPLLRTLCASSVPSADYEAGRMLDLKIERRIRGVDTSWRLAIAPAILGESLTMRSMPLPGKVPSLEELGFCERAITLFELARLRKDCLVFITGATGNGKTTTLYSVIKDMLGHGYKVCTIEDPPELIIPGTTQLAIRDEEHMDDRFRITFPSGIRGYLRHKPDALVVGEIRDGETAQAAEAMALSGHRTYGTQHSSSVRSTIKRSDGLGMNRVNLVDHLALICSQRLVLKLCGECRIELNDGSARAEHREGGCAHCANTGYGGLIVTYEICYFDEEAAEAILDGDIKEHYPRLAEKNFYISREETITRLVDLGIIDHRNKGEPK